MAPVWPLRSKAVNTVKTALRNDDLPVKPTKSAKVRQGTPGSRGWGGRGGGAAALVPAVREYRGTTVQVCGLWPFSSGTSSPMIGVPLGRHEETQATVCCDPISWFQRAPPNFQPLRVHSGQSPVWASPRSCAA